MLLPLCCDYGRDISIGGRTVITIGVMLIDVASIAVGNERQVGPNGQLSTPLHPVDPRSRRE